LIRKILLCLTGLSLLAGVAWSGPLYDPFLERFQVGALSDPADIVMGDGYPDELLEPVLLDTVWTMAARRVLADEHREGEFYVVPRLLSRQNDPIGATIWLGSMEKVIEDLEAGTPVQDWNQDSAPFLAARMVRSVFRHLEAGRIMQSAALAIGLRDRGKSLGLSDREIFVWDLRAKLLIRLAGNNTPDTGSVWPTMLALGPYDKGNAWALWVAHCRDTDTNPLPEVMTSEKWGRHLAGISRSWLVPNEIYQSEFSQEFQAGLGAVMFKGGQRDAHFLKFPDPPSDNALQGLWVRGKRLQSGGDPATYEMMADGAQLKPGWRMDVWRRASELRLLKGEWEKGIEDLGEALKLAGAGQGHWTTRRRLRQWNEQALVLALAQNDLATAHQLRDLGLAHFQGSDRDAFLTEVGHWTPRLDSDGESLPESGDRLLDLARSRVETGQVADLSPIEETRLGMFLRAARQDLWGLWIRWGMTLANPEPVQGNKKKRAIIYRQSLEALQQESDSEGMRMAALGIIGERLGESPVFERILAQGFDHDVGLACGWSIPPEQSAVPDILPMLRGSELDRHALLGFAMAVGDLRGILAVATELEGRGLTPEEKRRFLYPLPASGAIFTAITEAESDPALILAVARNESLFEPSIRSRAGALGWMQIMPFHYKERGALPGRENWRNPEVSIRYGDGLLMENSRRYHGNPYQAVAAYNAGPQAASRWERQLGGAPDRDIYLAWIGYPETRHYVEKVLIDREIYDWIISAEFSE
jgi:hypothetical protein